MYWNTYNGIIDDLMILYTFDFAYGLGEKFNIFIKCFNTPVLVLRSTRSAVAPGKKHSVPQSLQYDIHRVFVYPVLGTVFLQY